MIDLIVAEPNPLLRFSIRTVLETYGDLAICAEVADAEHLQQAFLGVRQDVLLIGLGLLTHIGDARLRDWRRLRPDSRILVHSYEIDAGFAEEASRFGVTGYLSNDCSASDLRDAILAVAQGLPYITRALGAAVAAHVCFKASNRPYVSLSSRDMKVFQMLSIGMNVESVARQLGTSTDTVQKIKLRIMARMALPDASDLVRRAILQTWQEKHRERHDICPAGGIN